MRTKYIVFRTSPEMRKLTALNQFMEAAGLMGDGSREPSDEEVIEAVKQTLQYSKMPPAEGPNQP